MMNIRIIQDVINVFDYYGENIRFDIDRFEQALNDEAPDLIDECYLVVLGMKSYVFDAMIFDEDIDYYAYVDYLTQTLHIKQNEAVFMISVFEILLKEVGYYFEVKHMPQLLQEAYDYQNYEQLFIIGKIYYDGFGVEQDYEKAFEIFSYLYVHGDDSGSYYLGYMYEYGLGVEQDIEKAMMFYENKDDDLCHLRLGYIYMLGKYGYFDEDIAMNHLQKTALPDARFYLGLLYEKRFDYENAYAVFFQGALQYHVECLYKMGVYLKQGRIISVDYQSAAYYFELSYYLLHGDSAYELGLMYLDGFGFEKNVDKGILYLKQASLLYSESACKLLSDLYAEGRYVQKDMHLSKEYYQKALEIINYTQDMISEEEV